MPSNHLILCRPLLLLPSIFPSVRVFSSELAPWIRWPKYWNFSFSINPSNDYSGLISSRIDWFDLLAVQGTLKSLLQYCSFFIVQLSHLYMTTGKSIALTRWTFVDKVMSLFFNMLSRLVIAFLPIDNAYFSTETQMFQCNSGAGYKNMFIPWHNLSTWSSISQCQGNLYR